MTITKIKHDEYEVEFEKKIYRYWVFGLGLLPLHKSKSLGAEFDIRYRLKREIWGDAEMRRRLKYN